MSETASTHHSVEPASTSTETWVSAVSASVNGEAPSTAFQTRYFVMPGTADQESAAWPPPTLLPSAGPRRDGVAPGQSAGS